MLSAKVPRRERKRILGSFMPFPPKQLTVLNWWASQSLSHYDAIICDGAVRSGKTKCMSLSFAAWAVSHFDNTSFAICGKTITSVQRNIVVPLLSDMRSLGFEISHKVSRNYFDVRALGHTDRFYYFGGKDESSASLIQGMTLGGAMLDEVVLMPRSFVEQTIARCSLTGSRLWFDCNPDNPYHWFKKEWIDRAKEKNALYIHFEMSDNPSLSEKILGRYKRLYSGVFYDRFVLGKWSTTSGLVYPMFDVSRHTTSLVPMCESYVVSCDYGTVNSCSCGLWGKYDGVWYRVNEYYYSSVKSGIQRTDEEHYNALERLCDGKRIECVIVDPSASSFIECIRRHGRFKVIPAKNDVISGVRRVSDRLASGGLMFCNCCKDSIREFSLYRWKENTSCDTVCKENDHAMDDIRYFVSTYDGCGDDDFFVASLRR